MKSPKSADDFDEALAAQHERLELLRSWERELEELEAVETELEVRKIGADVALRGAAANSAFGIHPEDAAVIARRLARKRSLEQTIMPSGESPNDEQTGDRTEAERLRDGAEALSDWLRAAATAAGWRRPRLAYGFIAAACLATIAAALTVHTMLLVLLVPLVMALGYLAFTDRDADWIRLGAVRRFGRTMLPPPSTWDKAAVEARLAELQSELTDAKARRAEPDAAADAADPETEGRSELALAMELVEINDELEAAFRKAGIAPEDVDDKLEKWLRQVGDAHRIGESLAEARSRRKSLRRSAEECRDSIFRFLAVNNAAPPGGRADADSLEARLRRLGERDSEI